MYATKGFLHVYFNLNGLGFSILCCYYLIVS